VGCDRDVVGAAQRDEVLDRVGRSGEPGPSRQPAGGAGYQGLACYREGVGVDSVVAEQRVVALDDGEVRADGVCRRLDRVQLGVHLVACPMGA
jgi:hypothetical protein